MNRYSTVGLNERRRVAREVIAPLLAGKKDRTIRTFYERSKPGADGKVRTVLAPRTASGRLASGESDVDESSTNLQNQPKKVARGDALYKVRDIFVPDPGFVLLAVDYRNAEGILCAAYSGDWVFYDQMVGGVDVHTMHARHYFGGTEISPLQRDLAKTIHYASLYMASPDTITRSLNRDSDSFGRIFTVHEVASVRAKFLQLHPLETWWGAVRHELDTTGGVLRNCFGFRRRFYDPDPYNRQKDGLSFFPQSTVACLMNEAIVFAHKHLHRPGKVELLLQIHDELLFQVREDEIPGVQKRLQPALERTFSLGARSDTYVPTEWAYGASWGQMRRL